MLPIADLFLDIFLYLLFLVSILITFLPTRQKSCFPTVHCNNSEVLVPFGKEEKYVDKNSTVGCIEEECY